MPDKNYWHTVSRLHFDDARRREWISALIDAFRHAPNDLLAFEEVRQRLQIRGQRDLGVCTVPIDHIVGSEGRYTDFDRHFLPRSDHIRERWMNVDRAAEQYIELPPVDLYKIGEVYFVRDGNHRISVARRNHQQYIDANVVELLVDVPLTADVSGDDLPLKEEYNDFLEWTKLHTLRPQQHIEFSERGGYLELIRHINAHRYFMGIDLKRDITIPEAIIDWYDTVYMPVIEVIRSHDALKHFPGRTEADLYRWIMDHRWRMLEESGGKDPGPEVATREYVDAFGAKPWFKRLTDRLLDVL